MAISINSDTGNIVAGGNETDGDLVLKAGADGGTNRIHLDARGANVWIGGNGADGDVILFPSGGDNATLENATIHMDGNNANIFAGGQSADGDLVLRAGDGADRIRLDAGGGNIWVGGNGADGDLVLFASDGDNTTLGDSTIHLNGSSGDIILRNADCAEEFDVTSMTQAEQGTVMALTEGARLCPCSRAYETEVVGVVAGAGAYRPGILLDKQPQRGARRPIALVGKTFVKVSDEGGPIRVGDLLTTSSTVGHAMRVTDPQRAFGAVIGKAIAPHERGTGLIPMAIALQ
nr:hypothetical protein [Nitrosomonas nitrosa]